jgi:hypothetical protein
MAGGYLCTLVGFNDVRVLNLNGRLLTSNVRARGELQSR